MKLRVIQENNIVIVTILSLSDKLKSKFKKRNHVRLIETSSVNPEYCGITLMPNQSNITFAVNDYSIALSQYGVLQSDSNEFKDAKSALDFVRKLKNSITLLNHGTEAELAQINSFMMEPRIEIFE